jgi:hypothetical protein
MVVVIVVIKILLAIQTFNFEVFTFAREPVLQPHGSYENIAKKKNPSQQEQSQQEHKISNQLPYQLRHGQV